MEGEMRAPMEGQMGVQRMDGVPMKREDVIIPVTPIRARDHGRRGEVHRSEDMRGYPGLWTPTLHS
jgi:hypothetical protein